MLTNMVKSSPTDRILRRAPDRIAQLSLVCSAATAMWSCGDPPSNLFSNIEASEAQEAAEPNANEQLPNADTGESRMAPAMSNPATGQPSQAGPFPTTGSGSATGSAEREREALCAFSPFDPPVQLTGLNDEGNIGDNVFGPTLTNDALTLIFSAVPVGIDENLFQSTRTSRSEPFLGAEPLEGINEPLSLEGTPYLTADDRTLYFFSDRVDPSAPGSRDIWRANRENSTGAFSEPQLVPGVNTSELDHLPWVSQDEKTILLVSDRNGATSGTNIWSSTRSQLSDAFAEPVELANINDNSRDERPFLTDNGLTLLFCSNRSGAGPMDLWIARRTSPEKPFESPEPLDGLNSVGEDIDPTLSADGTELFFSSDRSGTNQLYRAERRCL